MLRAAVVIGTRPEAIKLVPVYFELKKHDFHVTLISTGQHKEMLSQLFNLFDIEPDIDLGIMVPNQSLAMLTSKLFADLDCSLAELDLNVLFVQGDTTTAMVASMVGFYRGIQIGHVEAGLRTFNKQSPFPEEVNRGVISLVADFHFAPTSQAGDVLVKLGCQNVFITGNTVIDSLKLCHEKVESSPEKYFSKFDRMLQREIILITGHRRESFGEGFQNICDAIEELAMKYPTVNWIYPVHLNPNVKELVEARLSKKKNIYLTPPLPYDELVFLMSKAKIIITDSGGIQEEAPYFDVPVLVMRAHTERQEGVESGCSKLVGTDKKRIVTSFVQLYEDEAIYDAMASANNPYGDGKAAGRIVHYIQKAST